MSRILLADDSPHAQRMGERILRDEGNEVLTLSDGEAVLARLRDFDPDLLIMKADLPARSGYELCEVVKQNEWHKHVCVILTSGTLDQLNDELARHAGCDATLKKPFEASEMLEAVKPLLASAERARMEHPRPSATQSTASNTALNPELIRAAVAVALDEAYPKLAEDLTKRILLLLGKHAG